VNELGIEPAAVVHELTAFIRRAVEDFRREGAILGRSGGIDSAVVATLLASPRTPQGYCG
jgi:NH3-dependent NAD+ synthetase